MILPKILRPSIHLLLCVFCCFATSNGLAQTQPSATDNVELSLAKTCDEFEHARANLEIGKIKQFVLPTAPVLFADGKLGRMLLKELETKAKRKKEGSPPESIRVLYRKIDMVDGARSVAHVTELLGAAAHVESGTKVKPQRRTTTWTKVAGESQPWKVAAMHESPYSVWEKSIEAFEEKDKSARYSASSIVFIGSSSVRGWKTLGEDFPDMPILGRGFGGSQMIDSIMYAHRIVLPYQPSAVAVYAGDNDIGYGKSAEHVFDDFKTFVETLHATDPKIRIGFIAIKPSIKRWSLWPEMKKANEMVADYAKSNSLVTYLDIATPMLGSNGEPKPELFVKDGLHMTRAGYEVWTSVVLPWAKQ